MENLSGHYRKERSRVYHGKQLDYQHIDLAAPEEIFAGLPVLSEIWRIWRKYGEFCPDNTGKERTRVYLGKHLDYQHIDLAAPERNLRWFTQSVGNMENVAEIWRILSGQIPLKIGQWFPSKPCDCQHIELLLHLTEYSLAYRCCQQHG